MPGSSAPAWLASWARARLASSARARLASSARVGLAAAALAACNPPAREGAPVTPPPAVAPPPSCSPPPVDAVAYLSDAPCPWVLVPGDSSEMALHATDMVAPRALVVALPEDCDGRCRFSGATTTLGPVLLAVRSAPTSELPDAAFLGAALGGGTVRFAPLWFGRPVLGDSTTQGPSHALAPWVCGDALVLAVAGRLAEAASEEPAEALRRAAGVYELAEGELRRAPRPAPADLSRCTRIPIDLP